MSDFKKMSIDLKKLLKESGHDLPLTVVQEMLAKIHGHKNRHVALSSSNGSFEKSKKTRGEIALDFSEARKPTINMFILSESQRAPTPVRLNIIVEGIFLILKEVQVDLTFDDVLLKVREYYKEISHHEVMAGEASHAVEVYLILRGIIEKIFEIEKFDNKEAEIIDLLRLKPGECEPNVEAMDLICNLLQVVLSPFPEEVIVDYQRSDIEKIVRLLFRTTLGRFPDSKGFYDIIKKHNENSVLLERLSKAFELDKSDHGLLFNMSQKI